MDLKQDFLSSTKDCAICLAAAFTAHAIPDSLGVINTIGEYASFGASALAVGAGLEAIIHGADHLRGYKPRNEL